ncbi:DNA-directed RNA polymerase subunit D [Candidatus Woesearchaeota archaeon]|nr:DNA-directed RNA polymerase subunit D [Candidatus Woesearchaeota archaeon]
MVKLELKSKSENKTTFIVKESSPAYSNALRRIILGEVPVMAIEEVEFRKNNSALYDEVVAHRLGLVPMSTDLKSYELPQGPEDIEEKKAKCTVQFTLKEKGPKTVYASDLKTKDPKIKPIYPKMPIVKLLKDQEIELIATAILGLGKNHSKWSPCHVWYTYYPKLTINNKDIENYKELYPPQAFNKKGKLDEKEILENNLVDAVAHVNEDIVKVEYDDTSYLFHIESWGQLSPKEIITEALGIFNNKLDELNALVK